MNKRSSRMIDIVLGTKSIRKEQHSPEIMEKPSEVPRNDLISSIETNHCPKSPLTLEQIKVANACQKIIDKEQHSPETMEVPAEVPRNNFISSTEPNHCPKSPLTLEQIEIANACEKIIGNDYDQSPFEDSEPDKFYMNTAFPTSPQPKRVSHNVQDENDNFDFFTNNRSPELFVQNQNKSSALQQINEYESDQSLDDSVADPTYNPTIDEDDLSTSPSLLQQATPSDLRSIEVENLVGHDVDLVIDNNINEISFEMSPRIEQLSSNSSVIPSVVNSPLAVSSPSIRIRSKRKNEKLWKQNVRKALRNSGKEYVGKKGPRCERTFNMDGCKCKKKCNDLLTVDALKDVFKMFWELEDINRQRDFLAKNVRSSLATNSRVTKSRRQYTLQYSIPYRGDTFLVCKNFFLRVLDVSDKMIRTAIKKKQRSNTEIISPDKRGKHPPGIKHSEDTIEHASKHIDSFPTVPSHWCRKDTKKHYLEPTLNREKMFELYTDKCKEENRKPVSKTSYMEMLIEKNIGFHKPRKDQCWCHNYELLTEEEKVEKREQYELHIKRKEAANEEKNKDKLLSQQNRSYMSVNFDMEAVLYSPLLLGKPVFYKRKLASFNFTLFDTAAKQGYCYKWPEFEGKRGANEVATCLYLFLRNIPAHVSHIVLHSDCCPGQNRNSILLYMFAQFISSDNCMLDTIDLKFLEPGHTHMECDNMHAAIERASENSKIYVPDDWNNVIKLSVKTKPYEMINLIHDDFIDFKAMKESTLPTNIKATDGTTLAWNRVKWLRFKKDFLGTVFFKHEYDDNFKEAILWRTRSSNISTDIIKAYDSQIPISAVKMKDILEMCRGGLIPKSYHNFNDTLPHKTSRIGPESDEEDTALIASRSSYRTRRNKKK